MSLKARFTFLKVEFFYTFRSSLYLDFGIDLGRIQFVKNAAPLGVV